MADGNKELDALKAQIDELKDAVETEKGKNQGLLDDLKKAQRELRSKDDIKPEDLQAAEERADKAEADLKKLQADLKAANTRAEKAEKTLESEAGYTSKLLTENALNSALTEVGVKEPAMLKAVKAMFAGTAQVVSEGEDRIVKIGDKPLTDHIKEWSGTDEAKHFISAPGNSGGGAPGGKGGSGGKTMTRSQYNSLDQQAKAEAGAAMAKGELSLQDDAA